MNQEKLNIAEQEIGLLKIAINDVLQEALLFRGKLKENKFISDKDLESIDVLNKKENTIANVLSSIKTSIDDASTKEDLDIIDIPKSPFDEEENKDELEDVVLKGIDIEEKDDINLNYSSVLNNEKEETIHIDNDAYVSSITEEEVVLELTLYSLNGSADTVKITTIDELEEKKAKKKALHQAAKSYNKKTISQKSGNKTSKSKQKVKNNDRKTGFIEKLIKWFKSKF